NSHNTGTDGSTIQFLQPRELDDGRVLTLLRPYTGTDGGGELVVIDTQAFIENSQPNRDNPGLAGPAQAAATVNAVSTRAGSLSPGGRFRSAYPVRDGTGRMLVSWSQCRVV